jgi:hypothetical protein
MMYSIFFLIDERFSSRVVNIRFVKKVGSTVDAVGSATFPTGPHRERERAESAESSSARDQGQTTPKEKGELKEREKEREGKNLPGRKLLGKRPTTRKRKTQHSPR